MKLGELPGYIREMIALHEVFRRLGFAAADIHVYDNRWGDVGLRLAAQNHAAVFVVGSRGALDAKDFHRLWDCAAADVNDGTFTQEELEAVYFQSHAYVLRGQLLLKLNSAGFRWAGSIS